MAWIDSGELGWKQSRSAMLQAVLFLGSIVCMGGLLLWKGTAAPRPTKDLLAPTKQRIVAAYGKLPLSFELNEGHTNPQVKFLSRGPGYTLFLTSTEAVLALQRTTAPTPLRMRLLGANPNPEAVGLDELPGKSNYFVGNDPNEWHTNILHYAKVKYENVYPGIDLIYYGHQRQLECDFVIAPGGDPRAIRLSFEGAQKVSLDTAGNLVLRVASGDIILHAPVIYQQIGGAMQTVVGRYALRGKHEIGFEVADYHASRPLVIDPVLSYSTYLGGTGSGSDFASGITVDSDGNAYVTGLTESLDFPVTAGSFQSISGGQRDIFVTKLNATGDALVFSTYLGGSGNDSGNAIAVNTAGNVYVTGETGSTDFPTQSPLQPVSGGGLCGTQAGTVPCGEVFLTKLNPSGNGLVFSTYLGGSGVDIAHSIAVDSVGNAYLTGETNSTNFPITPGVVQGVGPLARDAFVTKVDTSGSFLAYSTYLGSNSVDHGRAIAVDSNGNAYVTGFTTSGDGITNDFPTTPGAFQVTYGGGTGGDAFVTKLDLTGSALVYSTYLGGSGTDRGFGIAVDADGNVHVTGETGSSNFPTARPFQGAHGGGTTDVFVAKLDSGASTLLYSTYLGGNSSEGAGAIAVDGFGNAYVTGSTFSTNFPTAIPFQSICGGCSGTFDGFVTVLNTVTSGSESLLFSSYLGGGSGDKGTSIAVDTFVSIFLTGQTASTDFPTTPGAFQTAFQGGSSDAFIAKISPDFTLGVSPASATVTAGQSATYTVTVSPQGGVFNNAVSLACSNLPTLTSCTFAPSTLTPAANPANSTLTVSTTAPMGFLKPPFEQPDDAPIYAFWSGVPVLALVGMALVGQEDKKRRRAFYLSLALLLAFLVFQVACGGGGMEPAPQPRPGTPTGTHTITITGASGSLQHSTTATLIVQ